MSKVSILYITSNSQQELEKIISILLEEGMVACANIIPNVTSLYRWQGELKKESEYIAMVKTSAESVEKVIAKIEMLHSYECPCVIELPVLSGNSRYMSWVLSQIK